MDVMWTYFGVKRSSCIVKKAMEIVVSLHLTDFRKGAPQDMTD